MIERRLSRWGVVVCLLFFFWLGVDTAVSKAPTVDEYMHIMRGRVLWQTQTFPFQQEHAPLAHWFIGSLLNLDPTLANVTELPSWPTQDRFPIAREFLWLNHQPPTVERILLLARLPVLFVGLLLGAVLVRWAGSFVRHEWRRASAWPMLVVAILFAFSPNLIAAFSIATTDAMLAATFVTAVFMMWRYWQRPSWRRWLLVGVFTGLALASKITALTLFPALGLICLVEWQRQGVLFQLRLWPRFVGMGVVYLLVTAVTLWAVYLFELRPIASLNLSIAIPAATYVSNFLRVQEHVNDGHVSFLLGELSGSGWWHYFAIAIAVKTPAVVLLLMPVAVGVLLWRRTFLRTIYFWLPALLLFLLASATRLNIGYRHILPIVPFLWLLLGTAVSLVMGQRGFGSAKPLRVGLVVLLGVVIVGTLRPHPHHLAYFNELVGGSANGAKYLGDSNLDWGQDIRLASNYVKQSGREDVHISYYGSGDLAYYGFADRSIHPEGEGDLLGDFAAANPAPGLYIVSVSHLQGMGVDDPDLLDWFRHQQPLEQLGFTTNVYDVPASADGAWVGYCNDPVPLLSPEESDRLLGTAVARRVYFDCRNSWVLPAGGQPGWYVLPQGEAEDWPLSRAFPDNMTLVYRHRPSNEWPSFDIYYWDGVLDVRDRFAGQTAVSNQEDTPLPITMGDAAQLVGYEQNGADWWTVWQATQSADPPTITIAGHLYGDAPPPTVSDGLGFSSEQWQEGDIIWQRHAFAPEVNGRYLETGLYNYITGERLADFVQLRPLPE